MGSTTQPAMDLCATLAQIDDFEAQASYSLQPLRRIAEAVAGSDIEFKYPSYICIRVEDKPRDGVCLEFYKKQITVSALCGPRVLRLYFTEYDSDPDVGPWLARCHKLPRGDEESACIQACIKYLRDNT